MYETDHSDALALRSQDANESLMGEYSLVQPVATEEVHSMMTSFDTNISDLRSRIVHLSGTVSDLSKQMSHVTGIVQDLISTQANIPLSRTTNSADPSRPRTKGLTLKIPSQRPHAETL